MKRNYREMIMEDFYECGYAEYDDLSIYGEKRITLRQIQKMDFEEIVNYYNKQMDWENPMLF